MTGQPAPDDPDLPVPPSHLAVIAALMLAGWVLVAAVALTILTTTS